MQYYETDKMGLVHHSNYIRWFEEARGLFFEKNDLDYAKWESFGIVVPVIEVSVKYRNHLTYGDGFYCKVIPADFKYVKFSFDYEIYNSDTNKLCTIGSTSHCFLDKSLKLLRINHEFPETFEKMKKLFKEGNNSEPPGIR